MLNEKENKKDERRTIDWRMMKEKTGVVEY
jgi:hypothetical protein